MPYTNVAKDLMLNALIGTNPTTPITHVSLHTADPGATGANEVSGGSPAYARQSITFSAASAGAINASSQPVFDVPGGVTITHVGFWNNNVTDSFLGSAAVTNETFGAQGTYTLTSAALDLNG